MRFEPRVRVSCELRRAPWLVFQRPELTQGERGFQRLLHAKSGAAVPLGMRGVLQIALHGDPLAFSSRRTRARCRRALREG